MLKITLTRAEGPIDEAGNRAVVQTFDQADQVLKMWANSAPKIGHDKVDFILGKAGSCIDYSGRYDLRHWSCGFPDLKAHVLSRLEGMVGVNKEHFADVIKGEA